MEDIINIGIPSKGRLRKDVLRVFKIDIKSNNKIKNVINGGRYDQLISDLGSKVQVSAVGAALNLNY